MIEVAAKNCSAMLLLTVAVVGVMALMIAMAERRTMTDRAKSTFLLLIVGACVVIALVIVLAGGPL